MPSPRHWSSGGATDAGLLRGANEDRHWVDDHEGAFLVIDGMGGHAAGEIAAETAVDAIRRHLPAARGSAEERIRGAITAANHAIYSLSQQDEAYRGMACVLTLALVEGDEITIGHVGDSRLYLIWDGGIRKLTSDHSPVGEDEDAGALSEEQAMLHPRRNEVFRDVGSRPHEAGDDDFIEVRRCQFKPDAAFLLCSDGLSDLLTSAAIRDIVERYDGDAACVAQDLVDAANQAGGKDNVTAVFVAGSQYRGRESARARHATTRMRRDAAPAVTLRARVWRLVTGRLAFLAYGMALGALLWAAFLNLRG